LSTTNISKERESISELWEPSTPRVMLLQHEQERYMQVHIGLKCKTQSRNEWVEIYLN
jgi:hypothetical protein